MSQIRSLAAEPRARVGKGTARAARREGRVPAVIYGDSKEPVSITLEQRALFAELHKSGFFTSLWNITVGNETHRVLARDVQFHPINDRPTHVDFLRVNDKTQIHVKVPVRFLNQESSVGIKRGGGLAVIEHEVELIVLAGNIPDHLEIDLAKADIGATFHLSNIKLPEGVRPAHADRDETIATISAPTGGAAADAA